MISWEEYAIEQRRVVKVYWLRFVFRSLLLFLYLNFSKYKISTKSIGAYVPLLINKMLVMAIYLDCLGLKILRCFAGISAKAPSVVSFWRYFSKLDLVCYFKWSCTALVYQTHTDNCSFDSIALSISSYSNNMKMAEATDFLIETHHYYFPQAATGLPTHPLPQLIGCSDK